MIRRCGDDDFAAILEIINDAASAYRGVIPPDCWQEPYMPTHELREELAAGVVFWGEEKAGALVGVMGLQHVDDVSLIRHAYVRTGAQHRGVGSRLLGFLRTQTTWPILVGTWRDARWAVRFYEHRGFRVVSAGKDELLRRYWSVPERQIVNSVILADKLWFTLQGQRPTA